MGNPFHCRSPYSNGGIGMTSADSCLSSNTLTAETVLQNLRAKQPVMPMSNA